MLFKLGTRSVLPHFDTQNGCGFFIRWHTLTTIPSLCRILHKNGYGEHFEQQPIDTEDGDLYVSFWNSGDNYSIMTRDELDEYIDNQGMTMGGM